MNMVREKRALCPARKRCGRLEGRLRGRATTTLANRDITVPPKYQFDVTPRGRQRATPSSADFITTSSNNTPVTSAFSRRKGHPSTSSAFLGSSGPGTSGSEAMATTTPGASSSHTDNQSCILAITTGRGDSRTEVGIAAIDLRYPHLILCQITDCQTFTKSLTKIYIFDPLEVLMPETMCDNNLGRGHLFRSIGKKFSGLEVTPISRIHFNATMGMERVRTLCAKEYASVELFVKEKYYALAAGAALLKYVECIQRIAYNPNSLRIEFQGSPYAAVIDVEGAQCLELVSSQAGARNVTLFGTLDQCSTPMGRRLLRASILQPSCDPKVILERQSCVAELVANTSLRTVIQPVVRRLYGADRLLSMSMQPLENNQNTPRCAEQNLNFILLLKNSLDIVPELHSVLQSAHCNFFKKFHASLANPEFRLMKEKILRIVHPDARSVVGYTSSNMQRCFAIRAGLNDLLDIARQSYCELIDDMKTMVENLAQKYKLPLSLSCSSILGYHIKAVFPQKSTMIATDFPKEFIQVRKNRNTFTMTTNDLFVASQQVKISSDELHIMSNILLCKLLKSVRPHVGCLFQLSADIAELDVIVSLAQVSSFPEYVRPEFANKLDLENSVHPIIAYFGNDNPVPNDIKVSPAYNFHVITGPNMSGKSTYLKQVVLLQIMAQIGCYVPAAKATFRIADRIFCRLSFHDDFECNASTFTIEIMEAQYILQSITSRSLVILDELCRGTTIEEGTSIAWAIYESLAQTNAFTFAATHFPYLTKMADIYYNVINHYFETRPISKPGYVNERLTYTHRLKLGTGPVNEYGIVLAEMSSLPKSITALARKLVDQEYHQVANPSETLNETLVWEKKCYDIVAKIYDLIEADNYDQEHLCTLLAQCGIQKKKDCFNIAHKKQEHPVTDTANNISSSQNRHENSQSESTTDRNNSTSTDNTSFHSSVKRKLSIESNHTTKLRIMETQIPQVTLASSNEPTVLSHTSPSTLLRESPLTSTMKYNKPLNTIDSMDFTLEKEPSFLSSVCRSIMRSSQDVFLGPEPNVTFPDENERLSLKFMSECVASMNLTPERNVEAPIANENHPSNAPLGAQDTSITFTPKITSTPKSFDYCLSDGEYSLSLSNISMTTIDAQKSVREKEAMIFRKIEGDNFESKFFKTESAPLARNPKDSGKTHTQLYKFPFFK